MAILLDQTFLNDLILTASASSKLDVLIFFCLQPSLLLLKKMASCMDKINVVLWIKCTFENPDLVIPDFSNLLIKLTFMSSDFLVAT